MEAAVWKYDTLEWPKWPVVLGIKGKGEALCYKQ